MTRQQRKMKWEGLSNVFHLNMLPESFILKGQSNGEETQFSSSSEGTIL